MEEEFGRLNAKLVRAIVLLNETKYLINDIPNRKYKTHIFKDSYALVGAIDKFLDEELNYDTREED